MQDLHLSRAHIGKRAISSAAALILAGLSVATASAAEPRIFSEAYRPEFVRPARVSCPQSAALPRTLIDAVACGDVFRVVTQLAEGANAAVLDPRPAYKGRSALHHAAQRGDFEIVEMLIAAGASVDAVDAQGNTPLHLLAGRSRSVNETAIARALVGAGADARLRNAAGRSPLAELLAYMRNTIDPLRHNRIPLAVVLDEAEASGPVAAKTAARATVVPVALDVTRVVVAEDKPVPRVVAGTQSPREGDVRAALDAWVAAWSARDVDGYVGHYAADFRPADGMTHEAWREQRRARLAAAKSIEVRISDVELSVDGARAVAKFKQDYRSDSYKSADNKVLVLALEKNNWRIIEEKTVR